MFGRKANQGKMEEQFRQMGAAIDALIGKAQKDYPKHLETLKAKQAEAQKKLKALSESGEDAWEDFKGGAEKALADLKSALESAAAKLKG